MTYDPFKRGKYPVGVRTVDINGTKVEVWYPATDEYVGQDLDEKTMDRYTIAEGAAEQVQQAVRNALIRTEKFPIILQSHAAVGHRRDAAPTCTHLASHGYIVTSPEFVGDTTGDILHDATVGAAGEKRSLPMRDNLANRESVVVGTLNAILNGAAGKLTDHMDVETVGALGVSLGGWTTMRLLSLDRNVKAAVLTVPSSGTRGPFEDTKLQNSMLRLDDWGRAVPTFLLAGDRDALIPLDDMCDLFANLPQPKRFGILAGASHFHWFERAEDAYNTCRQMWESGTLAGADVEALSRNSPPFSELCPNEHALDTLRALCVAQMDAHLKYSDEAGAFLAGDLSEAFGKRGIDFEIGVEKVSKTASV
ncbi:MAG: dienelactone hydrolase family protein [Acidobacteria bacterium]|nr:dienelactone hydrolase family protein [Acidobacteriota bacterium]